MSINEKKRENWRKNKELDYFYLMVQVAELGKKNYDSDVGQHSIYKSANKK